MRYGLPLLLFFCIHVFLLFALDLRDMPGAAGTETIYKAAIGERKSDATVLLLQWIAHYVDTNPQQAARILSSFSAFMSLVGLILCARTYSKDAGVIAGWMGACWTMSHYFPVLVGADPLAIGSAWLSVGLCWWGARRLPFWGLPALLIGSVLASFAVSIKEIALPPLALLLLTPLWFPYKKENFLWVLPIILYCAYWGYAWMWPNTPTRMDADFSWSTSWLSTGWSRLLDLYDRGLPQGKFDQLLILSFVLLGTARKHITLRLSLWILAGAIILFTAYTLGPRTRPRYISPSTLGILISIAISMSLWKKKAQQIFLCILCSLFLADTWAFFDVWGQKRTAIVGGEPDKIPTPPYWWRQQYTIANDITYRDISMYGAIDLYELLENSSGIASMRLRDERHRSLMAFAQIMGKPSLILDPGACCAGQPVNEQCAQKIVHKVHEAGYAIVLPTTIFGVERIYPNESRWYSLIQEAIQEGNQRDFWYEYPSHSVWNPHDLPCQQQAPFRNAK